MKKAFTLIEMMVAITIVVLGLSVVLTMGLSAMSNAAISKSKTKATAFANGILEKFRIERDENGIANFLTLAPTFGAPQTIDGVRYQPTMAIYYLNATSSIVETNVCWTYKTPMCLNSYVFLPNRNPRFKEYPGPYSTPAWSLTPTAVSTLFPTSSFSPTPTLTLTPTLTPTITPTPTTSEVGLVGYWTLNEASGGTAAVSRSDSSGKNNTLSDNNTVPSGGGKYSNAANFARTQKEFLSISDASQNGLDITGSITLAAWIKPATVDAYTRYIVSKFTVSGNQLGYAMALPSGSVGALLFFLSTDGSISSLKEAYTNGGLIVSGNWYHVAAVYNGTDMRLYINGALPYKGGNVNPHTYSGGIFNNTSNFRIGQGEDANTTYTNFDGLIDEVRVYNRALSAAEIQLLYLNNHL